MAVIAIFAIAADQLCENSGHHGNGLRADGKH